MRPMSVKTLSINILYRNRYFRTTNHKILLLRLRLRRLKSLNLNFFDIKTYRLYALTHENHCAFR